MTSRALPALTDPRAAVGSTGCDSPATLRWGVLSTARIAQKNCRAIALSEYGTLVAVASRSLDRASAFVSDYGCVRGQTEQVNVYGSYEELLDDKDVDAVYIPLPTSMHKHWVVKAAEKKKHVLIEKPVALSASEFHDMCAACELNGVLLMDGVMFMHNIRLQKIMRELDVSLGCMKGRPLRITSGFSFKGDPAFFAGNIRIKPDGDPLGCLGDLGWYCIRFAMCCMRFEMPTSVRCVTMIKNADGVPIDLEAIVSWGDGSTLSFHCSFQHPWRQWVEVCSGDNVLKVDDFVICRPEDSTFTVESTRLCDLAVNVLHASQQFSSPHVVQEADMFDTFAREVGDTSSYKFWSNLSMMTQKIVDGILRSDGDQGRQVTL